MDDQDKRIYKILGKDCEHNSQNTLKYFKYLKPKIKYPCRLTGMEDFLWEEKYVIPDFDYKPPIRLFLNREMEKYQFISDNDASELKAAFKNSIQIVKSLLGKHAFKRYYKGSQSNHNGNWEPKKFNASLYDILMYSFAREDKNSIFRNLDAVREALIYLMTSDQEFIDSIELPTSSIQAVTKRFDKWRLTLQQVVGIQHKETRCFSYALKQQIFDQNSTCEICAQKIQSVDDSALDHIEQFWRGGKTVPDNARLTHRFCNLARPRKD